MPTKTDAEAAEPTTNPQKAEATDEAVTFEWDGEEWSFRPSDARRLDYLAALEDADNGDAFGFIRSLRILLGPDDADRLFKGRDVELVHEFFSAAGEAAKSGNR